MTSPFFFDIIFKNHINMTDSNKSADANAPEIPHNVRVIHMITGEHVICNFTQVREEDKFVAYQCLYPLVLSLQTGEKDENGNESFQVGYRRWNPYSPYEDHRINPASVVSALPPAVDILRNYVETVSYTHLTLPTILLV